MSSRRQFHKYRNPILVETGTQNGEGVADALECGFEQVISFEIAPHLHQRCVARFQNRDNVKLVLGSSARVLYDTIKDVDKPITFWLDGHFSYGETNYDPAHLCPLLQEIDQIARLKNKLQHTILVDDRRLFAPFGAPHGADGCFTCSEEEIKMHLLKVNPDFIFKYEDGYVPNDILVAMPPTFSF